MGILKWLKSWLTTSRRPSEAKLGNPDLFPIDLEALTKELGLLEKAKQLGEKGLPSFDSKSLTGSEADVIRAIERHRQGNVEWAVRRLAVLSEAFSKRQVTQQINQARQADEEFRRNVSLSLTRFEAQLKSSKKQAESHREELEKFKLDNQLKRQSRHPSDARFFLACALVAFFILLEGFANAFTFSVGLDSGWIGGFTQAIGFAAINVLLAFFIGKYWMRQVFHNKWSLKIIGLLGILSAIAFICFMAFLIMHYRDSLAAGVENAASTALQSVVSQTFVFADIFSIILLVLSILFGVLALADGLFSDDLYPGYGSVSRRAQKSLDEYEADLTEAREELEELKEKALAQFEEILSRSQAVIATMQNGIEDKRTTASRVATAMHDADNSLNALLRRFRTENENHRGQVPRPPYFDEYPALTPVPLPNFDVKADVALLEAQRLMVEALVAESQSIRARIQASFSQQFDSLKTLDANFSSEGGR